MGCTMKTYMQIRRDENNMKNKSKVNVLIRWLFLKTNTLLVLNLLRIIVSMLGTEVCQASKVILLRKEPLSMTQELSKSMRWPNDHACFAMFDPSAHVLTFLICSFLQVFLGKTFSIRHSSTCYPCLSP